MGVGKTFSREDKSGKTSFYPLETKKTFFAKKLIGKYQISNSRRARPLPLFGRQWPTPQFKIISINDRCRESKAVY